MLERIKSLRQTAKAHGNPVLRDKSFELLLSTVKEKQPKKILEIGVNVGLSGIAMMLASPSSRLTGIEIDEALIAQAKSNYAEFGVSSRTKIFNGDASEIIPLLSGEYDFIFLDGPKGHYYEYLPHLLSVLSKGGILFADNVLYRGYVEGEIKVPHRHATIKHSMENFLREITENKSIKTEIYKIEDGISITEKL